MTSIAMDSMNTCAAGGNVRHGRRPHLITMLAAAIGSAIVLSSAFFLTGESTTVPQHQASSPATTGSAASPSEVAGSIPGSGPVKPDDRALAFGRLIDTPQAPEVLDEGIRIAEALRRRYGIDTGDLEEDRRQAAERARVEVLETMVVSDDRIEITAEGLGYSLDPAVCSDYCDNVRRLALLELKKQALTAFAGGAPVARNIAATGPGGLP
jgi:hypothetical protein